MDFHNILFHQKSSTQHTTIIHLKPHQIHVYQLPMFLNDSSLLFFFSFFVIITTPSYCKIGLTDAFSFVSSARCFTSSRRSSNISINNNDKSMTKTKTTTTMKIRAGLVGLPNVGKSTLFNSIAQKSIADTANFPFCTIEPNQAPVPIPDSNLEKLSQIQQKQQKQSSDNNNNYKALPATIQFIDVAGLVKNASRGEGLGNRFLATVRECDVILHVVRSYINDDIIHVGHDDGNDNQHTDTTTLDPVMDADVVNLELLLADLAHVERRLERLNKHVDSSPSKNKNEYNILQKVRQGLELGKPARTIRLSKEEAFAIKSMGLLTLKPMIYCFNVDDIDFTINREEAMNKCEDLMKQIQYCDLERDLFTIVSAKFESELVLCSDDKTTLEEEDRNEYLESLGMDDSYLNKNNNNDDESGSASLDQLLSYHALPLLVKDLLGLYLVYTGPGVPEERSRTVKTHVFESFSNDNNRDRKKTTTASDLAGRLHGEIQKGFIRCEVINSNDLIYTGDYNSAKSNGTVRTEGKMYELQSDDVVLIKWK